MGTRIVVVGAGFAGLNAAKGLSRIKGVELTVVDRKNHHLFQPLLYQVAMAGLSPADIAVPIRGVFADKHKVKVLMGEVLDVDLQNKILITGFGQLSYDYLILACGSEQSYFGHEEWREFAPGLKSLEEATDIRRRILSNFERAERESDPVEREKLLSYIVVGGGPTGVELAGSIGEISRHTFPGDFQNFDSKKTKILLLEGGPRILPSFSEKSSRRAVKDLEDLGVEVRTGAMVSDITEVGVRVGESESIGAATVLWAAGVKSPAINLKLEARGVELDRQKRVKVKKDLSLPGYEKVFVLGDQAYLEDSKGQPLPGLAPVAIQQGQYLSVLIKEELKGGARHDFQYFDKGQMATIGRSKAVAESFGLEFGGILAWLVWLVVHIYFLVGFRNRFFVFSEWAWSYATYRRAARLIVGYQLDDPDQKG